jgi:hypothetical protein
MRCTCWWLVVALGSVCTVAQAGQAYEGIAYAPGSQRVLYREAHWQAGTRHVVLYRCPDGRAFARKQLDYAKGAVAPDFEMRDARDGFRSGVATTPGGREVFVRHSAGQRRRSAALPSGAVVDAGFDAFIRQAWGRLAGGAAIEVPFLVPSRLKAMNFRLQPQPAAADGLRVFRLSLASWIGGVLPHIDVTYDAATRTLLRFTGMSDVRDGRGDNLVVDIRFPPQQRRSADLAALEAAANTALDGTCRQ